MHACCRGDSLISSTTDHDIGACQVPVSPVLSISCIGALDLGRESYGCFGFQDGSPSAGRHAQNSCAFVPVLRHGAASDRGPRHEMQDCHVGCDSFEAPAATHLNGCGNSAHKSHECTELAAVSHAFYAVRHLSSSLSCSLCPRF